MRKYDIRKKVLICELEDQITEENISAIARKYGDKV